MHHNSLEHRILALDVRSKTLAYAAFEGPTQLLDFSVSGSAFAGFHAVRIEKLVRKFQPDVIVMRKVAPGSSRDNPQVRAAVRSIRSKAKRLAIPVIFVEKRRIDETFKRGYKPTKYLVSLLLAACFPILTWYVPRKRKPYTPEDRRMHYFDAAGVGLAYFATEGNAEVVQRLLADAEARSQKVRDGP